MHDERGRPVSPDGAWVWDGGRWVPRQMPPPQPVLAANHAPASGPQPSWVQQPGPYAGGQHGIGQHGIGPHGGEGQRAVSPHPGPVAAPAPHAHGGASAALEAEVQSYPRLWRIARQGVLSIANHLEPGEVVQATAPGSGDLIAPALALITVAGTAQRSMIVVATDRRLLLCQLTVTSRDVASSKGVRYEDVELWRARKRHLYIEGAGGVRANPNQMVKEKLLHLRSVVEPRLTRARLDIK